MYWYGEGMGSGWYWLMAVSWILFLAVVVAAITLAIRYFSRARQTGTGTPGQAQPPGGHAPWAGPAHTPGTGTPGATAEQVLAERYARGEIDDEEYQRRLSTLRSAGAAPGAKGGYGP